MAASDPIPSIRDNAVKFLGRVINGSLTDRKNVEELTEKLQTGLKRIHRSKHKGIEKLWILQHLLVPRIRWPLLIYEIPMSHAIRLEQTTSKFIRLWLRIPRCTSDICFYSSSSPCPLPVSSLTYLLKASKVSGHLQLRDSRDPLVSSAAPVLKTGKWVVESAVADAEIDLKIKQMQGPSQRTSGNKAGLGFIKESKIPKTKQSRAYRKCVADQVKRHQEDYNYTKAVQQEVQCHWTSWTNYVQNNLSWCDLLAMPSNLLSFCLSATYNTLPSPSNLRRWNISTEAACFLCKKSVCTVPHVLSGCAVALDQGRYTFRHDSILKVIAAKIKDFIATLCVSVPKRFHTIQFVKAGKKAKSKGKKLHTGILHLSNDWEFLVDLGDTPYVFPTNITFTSLRPDIVIYSRFLKRVILIDMPL